MMIKVLIMAFTIASSVGASMSAATGRSQQGHICYAANQGAWWAFYLTSTQALSAAYSVNNGSSWSAPSGSPLTLTAAHGSEGRNFGFAYANLTSTDVVHLASEYVISSAGNHYHSRYTLGSTWSQTNAEATISGATGALGLTFGAPVTALTSGAKPVDFGGFILGGTGFYEDFSTAVGSNADSGTSWTAGFASPTNQGDYTSAVGSYFLASLGSGNMLAVCDNGAASSGRFTQLEWSKYNGSTWTSSTTALSATITQADDNAWGGAAVTTSNVIVVALSNNSNTYVARTFNGSSWSNLGAAPGTLAYGTNSGIACVSDGTNLWAFVIDTSKNIQYNKWNGTAWGGWTVLEATRTNTPAYITACYSSAAGGIMVAWTESTGTNFNIIGSFLATTTTPAETIGVASDTWASMMSMP